MFVGFQDVVEGEKLNVEVVGGHITKCSTKGSIKIHMLNDNGECLDATLTDVMYIPGLSKRLFSITKFAAFGHYAMVRGNATTLYFGPKYSPVTLLAHNAGNTLATDLQLHKNYDEYHPVPSACNLDHSLNKKHISLELLH